MPDKKALELADALADAAMPIDEWHKKQTFGAESYWDEIRQVSQALAAYRAEREKPARSWDGYAVWQDGAEFPDCVEATKLEAEAHYADEHYDTTPEQIERAFASCAAKYGLSIIPVRVTERSET